ncbi:MAG: cupin domain-containing protein [Chloroflexi bacterium]|nr:cupin domain-containing protein [Chloroflexota bacterium]
MAIEGSGEAYLEDEILPLTPDVTVLIPAGVVHGFRNTGTSTLRVVGILPANVFHVIPIDRPWPRVLE